ncbi:hypothetical protein NEPAR06_1551 [Nematocida parisii]|uniref:Uncharacterized protein n=1 Tax=Nematocida parisii (strain ERTm3) TaxID=935791 RepID=I3EH27_NEMP3|nr:uncharacterized protein NEPG_00298 [Nematocida parisii ERTm1]EIJ88524.1 hypothetical protein NEQG_01214 [Nematocida parisii ERTm3]KAI5127766.1 hypothetical protein NEPAR08_1017 [Nematocida parisii]EIJ94774.1 hypothetical protein NEPG_00298 [Nematocida parisii ERTm1]KAI5128204.1 hypothetical protein NEPAR03_1212 [Nematocida parisii]KAI5142383.1 hypothetical protein NEPAR04_1502 [Nematocida parisii]|eukprot:XP_013058130.1 hypothetical protein NEPG_00298 [Nematocida parisii ERTm1]
MNTLLVCTGLAVLPLSTYFIMGVLGANTLWKSFISMLFMVFYIIFITILAVRKAESEELRTKKNT